MITPGTTADWFMAAGLLGAVVAFGAGGYRWMLRDVDRAAVQAPRPELREFRVDDVDRVREVQRSG